MSTPPIIIPQTSSVQEVCSNLLPHLEPAFPSDTRSLVIMMCGCSGSGKSTLSKCLCSLPPPNLAPKFFRVSIDRLIYETHGMYGRDYAAESYEEVSESVEGMFLERMRGLLSCSSSQSNAEGDGRPGSTAVILDRAFYSKYDRMEWKGWIEGELKGRVKLIWFDVEEEELWRRIVGRRGVLEEKRAAKERGIDGKSEEGEDIRVEEADGAREISREMLRGWFRGFEKPEGEGEIVVRWMR